MDLVDVEREMARLDALYRPIAQGPVDPDDMTDLGTRIEAELAALGVDDRAQTVVRAIVELYRTGEESVRVAIRRLFDQYTSFRWAAHLPREWDTADEFRARLILVSAHDQGSDTRDVLLGLQDLCAQARRLGIDVDTILAEVAPLSSDEDRYGMGSMRRILQGFSR